MKFFLLAVMAVPAIASPHENALFARTTTPICSKVSAKCTASKELKTASAYCSSLVSITTVTNTVAPTTITVPPTCTPTIISAASVESPGSAPDIARFAVTTDTVKPPACFGSSDTTDQISCCNCLTFTTRTRHVTISTATVTGPFKLKSSGSPYEDKYAGLDGSAPNFQYVLFNVQNGSGADAQSWLLDQDQYLVNAMLPARVALQFKNPGGNGPVFVARNTDSYPNLKCNITQSTCGLECTVNLNVGDNYICYNIRQWAINSISVAGGGCEPFTPVVEAFAS